jgi:LysR family transcriptional regulator, nod-box dependent transcriptional activator
MHLRGLDLNLLVALNVLLKVKNITHAAERLHLSQSGMSTALHRLREYFDDQLLVPLGRKMVMTPLAESLAVPVSDILMQVQNVIDHNPAFDPAQSERSLKIMCSDYIASTFLPKVLQRMRVEAPNISVDIVAQEAFLDGPLVRGEVDFLILPEQFASPDHPSERLFSEHYVCIAWSQNQALGDALSFEDYITAHHVVAKFGEDRTATIDSWVADSFDRKRIVDVSVMNFLAIPFHIVGTDRLATVHARSAEIYARALPVRIFPLPFAMPPIPVALQWHRYKQGNPAIVWLRSLMLEIGKEH